MPELRKGFTTGSCAAAASKAAAIMLLGGKKTENVNIILPKGGKLDIKIESIEKGKDFVVCSVKKDSGDDPDITKGILIFSKVSLCERDIIITGGEGIGKVTKAGLDQGVGEYAINSVPRKSIRDNVMEVCDIYGYEGGIRIEISAPDGAVIAEKTFNPRLGIVGGISVLGTSGIVEPMSESALIDTIKAEVSVASQKYDYITAVPGNYGAEFAVKNMGINPEKIVTMSNFVGDTIEIAKNQGIKGLLIVGHIGKMVKLGGGIMNTHSKFADCRMEILAACGIRCGANKEILCHILKCNTTDEAVDFLWENGIIKDITDSLIEKIDCYLTLKSDGMEIGAAVFSNKYGVLCQSNIDLDRYR